MSTPGDKNGTSYQQFKHDRNQATTIVVAAGIWFAVLFLIVATWPAWCAWTYLVGTAVFAVYRLFKRTKLPKSSC